MNLKSTLAKTDDGTIQITFTLPWKDVEKHQEHVISEEAQKITVPGFRKGKAPVSKVREKISESKIIEHTLSHFYSQLITDIINTHKIKPAIYPRLEVLKAIAGKDWEVRCITCELPEVKLGDYRKLVLEKVKKSEKKTEIEENVLKILVDNIKIDIPKILIEEEVNQRLSQLLARIEKLGLQLESYLASIGKKAEELRTEYDKQAKDAISIELILGAIADKEGIKADDNQVEEAIKAASIPNTPEQKNIVRNVLQRRTVLDLLVALV